MIESGPIPAVHGVLRWRLIESHAMGLRRIPHHDRQADAQSGTARHGLPQALARPRHYAQATGAIEDFKKAPARLETIARAKAIDCDTIEIWFADEARIGQKNKITRRWAKRGTRPIAPRDQRTCLHLHLRSGLPAEIAATVAPAAHAILLVDQAGWHMSTRLIVPANITIIPLPPKCPELNPVENVSASYSFLGAAVKNSRAHACLDAATNRYASYI